MTKLISILGFLVVPLASAAPQAASSASAIEVSSFAPVSTSTSSSYPLTTEDTDALYQLHEDLVNIPSISDDETECAEWLEEYLGGKGYYIERVPVTTGAEGRFNVFAYPQAIRDSGGWPEVLVTSHIDTVSPYLASRGSVHANGSRSRPSFHSKLEKRTALPITSVEAAWTPKVKSHL
jgi:acetylornithine deacetylase